MAPKTFIAKEHSESRSARKFDQECRDLANGRVKVLDIANAEVDFSERWMNDITNGIYAIGGQQFVDALTYEHDIPATTALPGVLSDDLPNYTIPELRQHAIFSFILNSLPPSGEDGMPRALVKDCVHAGGKVGGAEQAWMLLCRRYHIAKSGKKPSVQLRDLLAAEWPRKLDAAAFQRMVAKKLRLADELGLNPPNDTADEIKTRMMWQHVITTPPKGTAYEAVTEKARLIRVNYTDKADRDVLVQQIIAEIELALNKDVAYVGAAAVGIEGGALENGGQLYACAACDADTFTSTATMASGPGQVRPFDFAW